MFDPRVAPIFVAAICGGWRIGRERRSSDRAVWICCLLSILNIALYWVLIPYRTQQRFVIQAVGLAAIPLAMMIDRGRAVRWLAVVALAFHLLTPQGWPFGLDDADIPWDLTPEVPNAAVSPIPFFADLAALRADPRSLTRTMAPAKLGVGLGCVFLGLSLAWAWKGGWRRRLIPVAGIVILGLAQTYVNTSGRPPLLFRFPPFADYLEGWIDLDGRIPPQGVRIAYAGTNLPFYLMGPDFRNEVRYINIDEHRDWLLHDYHLAAPSLGLPSIWPDTRPLWDRARPDYRAWLANLRSERIQLLVVARANPSEGGLNLADSQGFTIEKVWASSHPEVFTPIYSDRLFKVYSLKNPR